MDILGRSLKVLEGLGRTFPNISGEKSYGWVGGGVGLGSGL